MLLLEHFLSTLLATIKDITPIIVIIFVFRFLVIKKLPANIKKIIEGFIYVIIGLALFLVGLQESLFPLGNLMAIQLTDPDFIRSGMEHAENVIQWQDYKWVYYFSAAIGFATTIAEPALLAVALKANAVSAGAISIWGLRVAVAIGVAVGVALGTFRIVTGTPLHYYIIVGYVIVIIQTIYAPRLIIALAYDSGGVTTSTVTVPLVTALGLGLASTIPGRSTIIDGFGLIAFASLCPIIFVLGYAQISEWRAQYFSKKG